MSAASGRRARATRARMIGAGCAFLLAACERITQPCFTPASVIDDLRVLSVRVDPPEPVVDLDADEVPPMRVSALVVLGSPPSGATKDLRGSAEVVTKGSVQARLCVPSSDDRPQARPDCPLDAPVVGELPSMPSADQPLLIQPKVALLREALRQDPLHGVGGVKLRLQLDFMRGSASIAGTNAVSATKTLLFHLAGAPESVNHGLELVGLEVDSGPAGGVRTYGAGKELALVVDRVTGLRPLLAAGPGGAEPVEEYDAVAPGGGLVRLRERVTYKFYAANTTFFGRADLTYSQGAPVAVYGGLAVDEADEPDPGVAPPPHGLVSAFLPFKDNQSGEFWIVARDGRGAEAFLRVPYKATEERCWCTVPQSCGDGSEPPPCANTFLGCQ